MNYFTIYDRYGVQLATGVSKDIVRTLAQGWADKLGEAVVCDHHSPTPLVNATFAVQPYGGPVTDSDIEAYGNEAAGGGDMFGFMLMSMALGRAVTTEVLDIPESEMLRNSTPRTARRQIASWIVDHRKFPLRLTHK